MFQMNENKILNNKSENIQYIDTIGSYLVKICSDTNKMNYSNLKNIIIIKN